MRQEFPLVYRMSRSGRILCVSLGIIVIVAAGAGAVYFGYFYDKGDVNRAVSVGLCLVFMLLGLACTGSALRLRILVHADEIESRAFIFTKRMKRADISGFRILQANGSPRLRLESATPSIAALTLPAYVKFDARMDTWLKGSADHDAREQQASMDSILANPDLPGGHGEKREQLASAQRIAKGLFLLSAAVTGWSWFYPHPYLFAVSAAAVMTWVVVGVAATNGALYRLSPVRNDMGADLSAAFILPAGAVCMRALLDFNLLDAWRACWLTLGAAIFCMAALYLAVREIRASPGKLLTLAFFMTGYGFGAVTLADTLLDDSDPQYFEVRVLDKSLGGSNHRSYDLRLSPWGPRSTAEEVSVASRLYARVSTGDSVCV